MKIIRLLPLVIFGALAGLTHPAVAETHYFSINLTVDQASDPSGSGSGSGTATYDDVTGVFSWDYSFSGLSGMVTAAHFHAAPVGVSGPIRVTVPMPASSPNVGMESISSGDGDVLIGGGWYLNIHTDTVASGELRGQLNPTDPPVDNSALIASLEKKIKKLKKKAKAAKKKGNSKKAKKLSKKAKKLQKTLNALS